MCSQQRPSRTPWRILLVDKAVTTPRSSAGSQPCGGAAIYGGRASSGGLTVKHQTAGASTPTQVRPPALSPPRGAPRGPRPVARHRRPVPRYWRAAPPAVWAPWRAATPASSAARCSGPSPAARWSSGSSTATRARRSSSALDLCWAADLGSSARVSTRARAGCVRERNNRNTGGPRVRHRTGSPPSARIYLLGIMHLLRIASPTCAADRRGSYPPAAARTPRIRRGSYPPAAVRTPRQDGRCMEVPSGRIGSTARGIGRSRCVVATPEAHVRDTRSGPRNGARGAREIPNARDWQSRAQFTLAPGA